jgi:hypothetical protein
MSLLNSLDKKSTMEEIKALNENYLASKGLKRYGIIGGLESFKITGTAGLGKTSSVQRCIDIITGNKILINKNPYREVIPRVTQSLLLLFACMNFKKMAKWKAMMA